MEEQHRRRSFNINWDSKSYVQKRHHLFHFIKLSRFAFWKFCGMEKQKKYEHMPFDESQIDEIRDLIYNDYVDGINNSTIYNKEPRIKMARKFLYGEEKK